MKRWCAVLVAMMMVQPVSAGTEVDPLRVALTELRGHVNFVDFTQQAPLWRIGDGLMTVGVVGMRRAPQLYRSGEGDDNGKAAAIVGLTFLALWGVGGALKVTSRMRQASAALPVDVKARQFTTAWGLNQFMAFSTDDQYALARREPELAAFLIKLNRAYALLTRYRLHDARPGPYRAMFSPCRHQDR